MQGRHEFDCVLGSGRNCMAIEVKADTRFGERDFSALRAFARCTPGVRACVLACNGSEAVSLENGFFAIPIELLLS